METTSKELASMYHVGDVGRYHEAFRYIEKYHKTDGDVFVCPNCKRIFSEDAKVCRNCGCPSLR